jgi:DNA-binding NarL/FixJ family response regulator
VTKEPLDVAVVDDHPIFRDGVHAQFDAADPSIEVVGEFTTADDAVAAVPELKPSVTLMDLRMPKKGGAKSTFCGADAIRDIRQRWPAAVIVVMTTYDDPDYVREALSAGARGYLLKEDDNANFIHKIRLIADGVGVFSQGITNLFPAFIPMVPNGLRPFRQLTDRDHELLELLARGLSNAKIAGKLGLESKSVSNRLSEIRQKLQAKDREDIVSMAQAAGLGRGNSGLTLPENWDSHTPGPRDGGR